MAYCESNALSRCWTSGSHQTNAPMPTMASRPAAATASDTSRAKASNENPGRFTASVTRCTSAPIDRRADAIEATPSPKGGSPGRNQSSDTKTVGRAEHCGLPFVTRFEYPKGCTDARLGTTALHSFAGLGRFSKLHACRFYNCRRLFGTGPAQNRGQNVPIADRQVKSAVVTGRTTAAGACVPPETPDSPPPRQRAALW